MRFKHKILLLPIITGVIVGTGIGISTRLTARVSSDLRRVESVQYPLVEIMRALRSDHAAISEALRQAVAEGDKSALEKARQHYADAQNDLERMASLGAEERTNATAVGNELDGYYQAALTASRLLLGDGTGDSGAAVHTMQQHNEMLHEMLANQSDAAISDFRQLLALGTNDLRGMLNASVVGAVSLLLGLAIGSWILISSVFRSLGGDLEQAVQVVRRLASGDFTQRIKLRGSDSNSLLHDIAGLQRQLGTLIREVRASSGSVDTASNDMNHAVALLSERTCSQAASIEECATSMKEMTETVRKNANNARDANQLAAGAHDQAQVGGDVVVRAVSAMADISASSRRIADIIGVIDDIAFQTNLLALNAAVEAARAGDQGRGFAVVATEVRSLSLRSAAAAREIKSLIQVSVGQVQEGSVLVDETGKRLLDIVQAVNKVAVFIGEISSASQDQALGLDQISGAVGHVDSMTQQNEAMVQQITSVAGNVANQAKRLTEIVDVFVVDAHSDEPPALSPMRSDGGSLAPISENSQVISATNWRAVQAARS